MPLQNNLSLGHYITFNQDNTCITFSDDKGFKIYSLETYKICYLADLGGIRLIEMLYSTSLAAFVGSGDQPSMSPRKLTLMNTTTQSIIQSLSFPTSILAVRMNRQRLVVVLERRTYVHALDTLALCHSIETEPNPLGLCALTVTAEPCLLVLPASGLLGTVRVYNISESAPVVLCELAAHKTPLAVLAWSPAGNLLATGSTKGTVIRVYQMPHATKVHTFRRGTYPAVIHSLAFSPTEIQPPLLAAASASGTVHVFSLEEPGRLQRSTAQQAASGLLSAVFSNGSMSDVVDPPRCILTLRLPCQGIPALVALDVPRESLTERDFHSPHQGQQDRGRPPGDNVRVRVATGEGMLYQYTVEGLTSPDGPTSTKDQEYFLLRAAEKW